MPYFRPRKAATIEAYRLPLEGKQASDALVFFLRDAGLEELLESRVSTKIRRSELEASDIRASEARPGHWVVMIRGCWTIESDEDFQMKYEPFYKGQT